MNNERPSNSIRINFKTQEMESISFLMKQFSKDSIHDLIRFLISKTYAEQKENELKYAKGNSNIQLRRQRIDETISKIKSMSSEELQDYLLEIGYFSEDHEPEEEKDSITASDILIRDRIYEVDGEMQYVQERYSKSRSKVEYSRIVYVNLDEIIRALQKDKLI